MPLTKKLKTMAATDGERFFRGFFWAIVFSSPVWIVAGFAIRWILTGKP